MPADMERTDDQANERPRLAPKSPRAALIPEELPPAPSRQIKKTGRLSSMLNRLLSALLFGALLAAGTLYMLRAHNKSAGPLPQDLVLLIPPRSGMSDIAKLLHQQNVVVDPTLFQIGVVLRGAVGKLRAGEYLFPAQASVDQVVDILRGGKSMVHRLAVPEGLTSQQVVQRVMQADFLVGDITQIPPEGTLLPDTYHNPRGLARSKLIEQMAAAQRKVVEDVFARRPADAPYRSVNEFITLASIVEKETGKADERPHVASVFINRLKRGMKLQSDPTIIYGLAGGRGALGRALTREDIDSKTPYNTYVISGLPPTPICNPGLASLEAVVAPLKTDDLYFVADGTGGHAFAPTLTEHNANVSKWRALERSRDGDVTPEKDKTSPPVEPPLPAPPAPSPKLELRLR